MLQKLLIALCTLFVLSACGGSLDMGPDEPPPPPENGSEDDDDEFEPGEPEIWAHLQFENEESIETWAYRCQDGCNASAELSWHADEQVLAVSPEWASEEDQLEVYTPIDEITNLDNAAATAWVYVTEDYIADGDLEMQMFLSNAAGETAYTRAKTPNKAGWHKLEIWEMYAGTAEEYTEEEREENDELEGINYGSFVWHSEDFSLRNIDTFGIQFSANGKPVDVGGDLWIDDVVLTPGIEEEAGPLIAEMDSEHWSLEDGGSLELQRGDEVIYFYPDGEQQWPPKLAYMLDGPTDISGSSFTITFSVDQAYIESGGNVDAIVQQNFGDYEGNAGDCHVPNEDLVADEETDITCSDLPAFAAAEEGDNLRVGIEVDGSAGEVRVHALEIEGAGEPVEPEGLYEASLTEGWRVSDDALNLEYTDDGVSYSPVAEDDQLVYDIEGPREFDGGAYTILFDVTQDFIDSGPNLQPIIQRNDEESSEGDWDCWINNEDLEAGENEHTCDISGEFDFDSDGAVQVGVQAKGDDIEGTVTIKSLTVDY